MPAYVCHAASLPALVLAHARQLIPSSSIYLSALKLLMLPIMCFSVLSIVFISVAMTLLRLRSISSAWWTVPTCP